MKARMGTNNKIETSFIKKISVLMGGKGYKSWNEVKMEGRMLHQVQVQVGKEDPQFKQKREN